MEATPSVAVMICIAGAAGLGFLRASTASRNRSASNMAPFESVLPSTTPNFPEPPYRAITSPGLWMCGSATHPGGGVMAAPGANAAREILGDLKRRNVVPEAYSDD